MYKGMKTSKRSHTCGTLGLKNIGESVKLSGWVQRRRDLGGLIFVNLRDRSGIIQVVFDRDINEEAFNLAHEIRNEFVLTIRGVVTHREKGQCNDSIPTGHIEIKAEHLEILNTAKTPPIYIDDDDVLDESIRLKYRYLDLRKPKMQNILMIRHKATKIIRDYLDQRGFVEIETPILTKPTPEGARDFMVPSRVQKGSFFALPQSPQLFKQILMVSGMDRYYQIVKCFRDEDLRADRQPEFTQIDIEMSFINEEDIMYINERMIVEIFKKIKGYDIPLPIERMTYKEAMDRFGTDKPDTRFGFELKDLTNIVTNCEFNVFSNAVNSGGSVRAINAKGCGEKFSRREIDALGEFVKQYKAKGLAWINIKDDSIKSPISKFLSEKELTDIIEIMDGQPGDLIFIVADKTQIVYDALGQLRLELSKKLQLTNNNEYKFLWITEFPLLEFDNEEKRYTAMHHPFTSPIDEDISILESHPDGVRAKAYDLVVNGVELGGGSIRIHNSELQEKMFNVLGFSRDKAWEKFGFLLEAFKYGTPPHGGIAFGLDRLIMILTNTDNIKDVIAFPKTQNHSCLMTEAPSIAEEERLEELGILVKETE
ncbi:MAG TPA: aspartate--tRNA ligase [Eubacteriaceae bacterium]|nr:aspartate--tRNA ligase [Eubacteriaceae bacterium]